MVYASRDRLLLAETSGDPLIRFNESLRLQVLRTRSAVAPGGALGFAIGALAGWLIADASTAGSDQTAESVAGLLVGGIAGASIGAFLGNRIRHSSCQEVTLEGGQLAAAPLEETATDGDFSLSRTYRWTRFKPTVPDFHAFFDEHAASLSPVEGIWTRHGTTISVAIVRVPGIEAEKYAAFTLILREGWPRGRDDGVMIFAVSRRDGEEGWTFQVARMAPCFYQAYLGEDVLELEYPGGWRDIWEKVYP